MQQSSFFQCVKYVSGTARRCLPAGALMVSIGTVLLNDIQDVWAQVTPSLVDRNLAVRTVVTGLVTPSTMAFLGSSDLLVLEKNTGKVKRIIDGVVQPALAVPERAPTEKLAVGKMHERKIPTRFKQRNVLDPHDPTFDIVSQEDEIVTIEYGGQALLALISGSEHRSLKKTAALHLRLGQ